VHVYHPDQETHVLEQPERLSADPVMRGFVLDLAPVWGD
jgi:Uma2 family endonuclease